MAALEACMHHQQYIKTEILAPPTLPSSQALRFKVSLINKTECSHEDCEHLGESSNDNALWRHSSLHLLCYKFLCTCRSVSFRIAAHAVCANCQAVLYTVLLNDQGVHSSLEKESVHCHNSCRSTRVINADAHPDMRLSW